MSDNRSVTVSVRRKRFLVMFSVLPGREFGPWVFDETVRDLTVSAMLTPQEARNLVLDAHTKGSATINY